VYPFSGMCSSHSRLFYPPVWRFTQRLCNS